MQCELRERSCEGVCEHVYNKKELEELCGCVGVRVCGCDGVKKCSLDQSQSHTDVSVHSSQSVQDLGVA